MGSSNNSIIIDTGFFVALGNITRSHIPRTLSLLKKYHDLPMDMADASLVILAEHLGHGNIVSTDQRDFNTYQWKNHQPFTNLWAG